MGDDLSTLEILVVGSSGTTVEDLMGEIRQVGLEPRCTLVGDENSLTDRLGAESWDLVMVNDGIADLSTTSAVAIVHAADDGVPIIVVCSRESEDEAIATMRAGGRDYLLRDDLRRLGPVVVRELENSSIRRDQVRFERALTESEARFRAIVEDQTDFLVRWKPDGTRTFVNRAYCDYFRGSPSSFIGTSFVDGMPEQHRGFIEETLAEMSPENPVVVAEPRVPRPNGEVVYHEWVNRGIFDSEGELIEIQSVGRDVTKQRMADEAERQRQLLVEVLRDTSAALNTTLDLDEVFDRILANIGWVIPHNASAIFFAEGGKARVVRLRGWEEFGIDSIPEQVPLTFAEMAALATMMDVGKPIVIQDTALDGRWQPGTRRLEWVRSFAAAPLFDESKLFGVLALFCKEPDYFTSVHLELLEGFASQAATASRNARLFETVSKSRSELRELSTQIVQAQEDERRKISQELHDGVAQTLTAVVINAELLLTQVVAIHDDRLVSRLRDVAALAKETLQQIRDLSHRLRPAMLDELGLVATLGWFTRRFADWSKVEVDFRVTGIDEERLESDVETGLYRVVQESLTNVVRHSETGRIEVELVREADRMIVRIKDDGTGGDPTEWSDSKNDPTGIEFLGMKERVTALGGSLTVSRSGTGGIRIDAEVPLVDSVV
jgi:PAS domain S-box-containing protein